METYWTEIEYRYSEPKWSEAELKGGFVYAFVRADDVRDALSKFEAAMAEENLIPSRIRYVSPYGETSWQKEEDQRKFDRLVKDAEAGEEVVFDDFYAFRED
jgi:hypothetical protein